MAEAPVEPNAPPDFRCRVCGCDRYIAIEVKRPSGKLYRTPFNRCCGCSVIFGDPLDFADLRMRTPDYELYRLGANLPGSKPMIPPAANPFVAGRKRR